MHLSLLLSALSSCALVVAAERCTCSDVQQCFKETRQEPNFEERDNGLFLCRKKCDALHFAVTDKFTECFNGDYRAENMKQCIWREAGLCPSQSTNTRKKRNVRSRFITTVQELQSLVLAQDEWFNDVEVMLKNITSAISCVSKCYAAKFVPGASNTVAATGNSLSAMTDEINDRCHEKLEEEKGLKCPKSLPDRTLDYKAYKYCQEKVDTNHDVCSCIMSASGVDYTSVRAYCNRMSGNTKLDKAAMRPLEQLITDIDAMHLLPHLLE